MDNGVTSTESRRAGHRSTGSTVRSPGEIAWPEFDAAVRPTDTFARRHIGPNAAETRQMLEVLGYDSLEALVDATVPRSIRTRKPLGIGDARGEFELLEELKKIAAGNKVVRSLIGMGYSDTITPPVIQRNILENPGWYTQYTPYQAEIAQGRLEAMLNFQTMVSDLTALPLANASLLDEGTAAAEAMNMCHSIAEEDRPAFFVSDDCHPQTIAVVRTRARPLAIECVVGPADEVDFSSKKYCGILLQYPTTDGRVVDYSALVARAHAAGVLCVVAADLLALTLIRPPGEFGADIAVGSTQRFGVPMGFGGPHAAYMATRPDYARKLPGRLVGVSRDALGNPAYRLAIQTREQHIRREKATSNICTAQVLLAVMASMYAVYHGPRGLKRIAQRVHRLTRLLADRLTELDHELANAAYFDTLRIRLKGVRADAVMAKALSLGFNLRRLGDNEVGVSLDETTTAAEVDRLLNAFVSDSTWTGAGRAIGAAGFHEIADQPSEDLLEPFVRASSYLSHPVFNRYHSETEMLRYIRRLESRDLSLTHSMIPLGSCTMKLNATSEMLPVTWPAFSRMHPFAPADQSLGYQRIFADLERRLSDITGFAAVSLQPNAGSQGEYAGLLAIRGYHESRGQSSRDICLIPVSAHGTNPSSAVIAGFKVVSVACDARGNVELEDLKRKAAEHAAGLGALMITYPSTHGVFEEEVAEICRIVHEHGGQVYMDGANMNAQVGLTRPAEIGADVCHLNLHKTFCIPHGGGGPGMGPIGVAPQLVPFLPGNPLGDDGAVGPVSSANYGSASILLIPWVYIALMGDEGLTRATEIAILNANYMAKRLAPHYPVLFKGQNGRVAHEFVIDCRQFESRSGVKVEDIAKRLMDYGFHAPTMSWPVPGTLMIEPTESESKAELDRFCDAMISIREEIRRIEQGKSDRSDNVLKNAPHTADALATDGWKHSYSRQEAAFPAPWLRESKFWPFVARIDNPWGDRNLVCTCPPITEYDSDPQAG